MFFMFYLSMQTIYLKDLDAETKSVHWQKFDSNPEAL